KGLNKKIAEEAIESGLLSREKGLRLFGRLSRPIHKALMYTTNPYIPGISENESGAIQFLSEIDFDPKKETGGWRKLKDLSEEERKTLASAIIQERIKGNVEEPEEIFGQIYDLENFEGKFTDARELSTALNACGRMSKPEVGVLACAGDEGAMEDMKGILNGYKKLLGRYINMVKENKGMVHEEDGFVWIDGIGQIHENFIGTVSSILRSSIADGKPIMGIADSQNDELKISIRVPDKMNFDLGEALEEMGEEMGCETGGHEKAGGGYIKEEQREEFLDLFRQKLPQEKAI
ncbi:MAG: DHH family phosphoesterase, partial [Candidatus Aenigmatarchaeota archaeon]